MPGNPGFDFAERDPSLPLEARLGDTKGVRAFHADHSKAAFYIKLGRGGRWESECLRNGTLGLRYRETPHDLSVAGAWDQVREFWTERRATLVPRSRLGAKFALSTRPTKPTFSSPSCTAACTGAGARQGQSKRWRTAAAAALPVDGWHNQSVKGLPLTSDRISGHLLKVQMFQGTICQVKPLPYLLRKLNDELSPEARRPRKRDHTLMDAIVRLMRLLTWQDFELLVDLVFSRSGWRRG